MVRITISGFPGSGKTSVGRKIAERFDCSFYSMGDLRGKMAMDRGISLNELNRLGEAESWTDKDVDNYQKELGEKEDNFVMEGRLSYFFIPQSIKVFLKVDLKEGARRIFVDQRADEEKVEVLDEMIEAIKNRVESDRKRYKKYYDIDCYSELQYDIVVDSTDISIDEVAEEVILKIREHINDGVA